MTASVFLQSGDLLPEALSIPLKLVSAIMVVGMLTLFLVIGYAFKVADAEGMWAADRSISNVENGMVIGANWTSAASYLGLAGLVVLPGFYGFTFIIGWTAGYFVLLIFLAAQMRRFRKYTAPDSVGDRFNSDTVRAIGALATILIGFVYSVGQARGVGLVGLYVSGTDYVTMVIVMIAITVGYLTIPSMMGATKNMAVQYVILIITFLTAVYVVDFAGGYSTVLSHIEYGQLIGEFSIEFSRPFTNARFYLWITTTFLLIFDICGLPYVLVRFYTVGNEKTARQSIVWGLFFILFLYWSAPVLAAFGVDLYDASQYGPTFAANGGMSGGEGGLIVVLAAQLSDLPTWFVGPVATGGVAAVIATTAGLFITASPAVFHDICTNIINPNATQRQQVSIGRVTIVVLGIIVTAIAFNPPALVGELVVLAFSLAATALFPTFFLGLWWENTNRQGTLADMSVGLTLWVAAVVNDLIFHFSDPFAEFVLVIGAALVGMPLVFVATIVVSMATDELLGRIKKMVRQCHSPEPMGQQQSAEDVVMSVDGGQSPTDG